MSLAYDRLLLIVSDGLLVLCVVVHIYLVVNASFMNVNI